MEQTFTGIYDSNGWCGNESRSGTGSDLGQTEVIRRELPKLFKTLGVKSILDIPCGDFWWFKEMKLGDIKYIGADIVPKLIDANRVAYPDTDFSVLDLTHSPLPECDLVFCRDCLGHLSNSDITKALANIKASGAEYLLTTTFPNATTNREIDTGSWRPVNIALLLGEPLLVISEDLIEANGKPSGKSLGLWKIK